jgi:hypothetical protein
MNLAEDIYPLLENVPWLSTVGCEPPPQFDFPVSYAKTREAALIAFNSELWADAKTEAQGDLTGYLSKHHYDSYGGSWNRLARQSRELVERTISAKLTAALERTAWPTEMIQPILVDVNRAALEISYRRKFPKAPVFFERLLRVYEEGRLPCGWNGDLSQWPAGNVIVF